MEKKIKTLHNLTTHSNGGQGCDIAQLIYFLCIFACKIGIRRCIFNLLLYREHFLMSLTIHWNSIFSWLCNIPMSRDSSPASLLCAAQINLTMYSRSSSLPRNPSHFSKALKSLSFFLQPKPRQSNTKGKRNKPSLSGWSTMGCLWDTLLRRVFLNLLLPPDSPKTGIPLPSACSVDVFPFYLLLWASSVLTRHNHTPLGPSYTRILKCDGCLGKRNGEAASWLPNPLKGPSFPTESERKLVTL